MKDAQRGVDNTVLKAPIGGTVSAINGAVGDFIAAQGAATDLAPGSDARIPPAQGSATGDAGAAAGGATGSGSFITLNNVDGFQLIVPFEESDAAKLAPNQVVDVSVDAIPGVSKPGTVTAVAPSAQQVSGVNSYYTTIVVNETDPRMRDGQTAQAQVTTQKVDNVLRVPTAAIKTDGGSATASVPGPDGKPIETRFTPGLAGDAFTEVKDGLREGQDILLPQATVTATQGGGGPRGGG
ncbi:efflux RND transporter periplasmic adaptor subunit [Pseudonocardia sp. ICBG601]|uniref:efflux RND transporter periplasmic adaptor subunit n=1 Tax=Pseudonocardia sp. ICBG601 TaxID=2846759 RepID=UPI001CF7111B|nr:hypothetical protein [Pseudonocardia sp. ICBG601]